MSEKEVKLCVFGAGGVGKSAMSIKFVQGKFVEKYDPTVSDSFRKQEDVDGEVAIMEITDTAGQEEYKSLRAACYQKAEGFLAVYSVADRSSYSEVCQLRDDVLAERNCGSCPMVLCGNKCDVSDSIRKVTKQEGEDLARTWFDGEANPSVHFFETSAKQEVNIHEAFHQLVREIRKSKGYVVEPPAAPAAAAAPAPVAAAAAAAAAPVAAAVAAPAAEAAAKHVDPTAPAPAAAAAAAAAPAPAATEAPKAVTPASPASPSKPAAKGAKKGAKKAGVKGSKKGAAKPGGKTGKDKKKKDKKDGKKSRCSLM